MLTRGRASVWEREEHLQGWGWSQDPAFSGAVVVGQPSVQGPQGSLLGKTTVHLPSVVHSWLLEKERKKKEMTISKPRCNSQ